MRRFPLLPGVLLGLLIFAAEGSAQTRFTIGGGLLVPFGDLEELNDPSFRGTLRFEAQSVNALGKRKLVSAYVQASYTDLALKSEIEEDILADGEDSNAYLIEAGGGARFYSRAAPLYLQIGAHYLRWRPGGSRDGLNGGDVHAGLGFLVPLYFFFVEADAAYHLAVMQEDVNFQFLTGTVGVSMPF